MNVCNFSIIFQTVTSSKTGGIMKKSNCSECGSTAPSSSAKTIDNNSSSHSSNNKANLSYWTPQTHRRSNHNRSKRGHHHHHRKSEMIQSMVYSHKQHQFYSPQLQRRKSEDYINYHKQYRNPQKNCETSDSSEDEIELSHQQQQALFTSSQHQQQQLSPADGGQLSSAVGATCLPVNRPVMSQQQPPPVTTRRLQYYGGVHPVYLPNSRSKAEKLQKMPLYHQHCQGCCQHQHHRMKTGDDKRCIIS